MSFYEDLVTRTQMNYSRYYSVYAAGRTPYELTDRPPLPYERQIGRLVREIREADCVVKTMNPIGNISADMRRNIISKEPLTG